MTEVMGAVLLLFYTKVNTLFPPGPQMNLIEYKGLLVNQEVKHKMTKELLQPNLTEVGVTGLLI